MARVGKDKQPRKHSGRPRKEQIVEELLGKIEASNGLVFADYQGLTNKQTEDLKKQLKDSEASFAVTKNTLLKLSLSKSTKYADLIKEQPMDKPTATLFLSEDVVTPLKAIAKSFKELNLPKIKFGIIDGQALDESQLLKLATLPNKETLIAQFVGTLNSPITGLVVTLNGTIQKFVMTLSAIAKAKPADAAPAPAPVEPAAESAAVEPVNEPVTAAPTEAEPASGSASEPVNEAGAGTNAETEQTSEQVHQKTSHTTPSEAKDETQTQDNQGGDLNG